MLSMKIRILSSDKRGDLLEISYGEQFRRNIQVYLVYRFKLYLLSILSWPKPEQLKFKLSFVLQWNTKTLESSVNWEWRSMLDNFRQLTQVKHKLWRSNFAEAAQVIYDTLWMLSKSLTKNY